MAQEHPSSLEKFSYHLDVTSLAFLSVHGAPISTPKSQVGRLVCHIRDFIDCYFPFLLTFEFFCLI